MRFDKEYAGIGVRRDIEFDDVLRQPVTIQHKDATIQLDALVTAIVTQYDGREMEIYEYDYSELHLVVPGLQDELVKLDLTDFRANQKELCRAFEMAVEKAVMSRAQEAGETQWTYILD